MRNSTANIYLLLAITVALLAGVFVLLSIASMALGWKILS